jgi:shikimate dehydrogenase
LALLNTQIAGKTKILGIIGDPVNHSLSPQMHNAAFKRKRMNYVYLPFHVRSSELKNAVLGMKALGIEGLNVTIPHKVRVVRYLDELDESAKTVGAVNTIANLNGKLIGYNTDGQAALDTLKAAGCCFDGGSVLILGAGGAARAIAYSLFPYVDRIIIANRTISKAESLARLLRRLARKKVLVSSLSRIRLKEAISDADLVINATPVGMSSESSQSLIPSNFMRPGIFVFDVVYNPPETQLLRNAKRAGARAINGVEMLVRQGALSFQLWTGIEPPLEVMRNAVLKELRAK